MNAGELADLRDRVARARLQQAAEAKDDLRDRVARARRQQAAEGRPSNKRGWPEERLQASADALVALRAASAPRKRASLSSPYVGGDAVVKDGAEQPRRTRKPCIYCGAPTERTVNPAACRAHRDLPASDPHFQA